jgi:hypothetical protein
MTLFIDVYLHLLRLLGRGFLKLSRTVFAVSCGPNNDLCGLEVIANCSGYDFHGGVLPP